MRCAVNRPVTTAYLPAKLPSHSSHPHVARLVDARSGLHKVAWFEWHDPPGSQRCRRKEEARLRVGHGLQPSLPIYVEDLAEVLGDRRVFNDHPSLTAPLHPWV